MVFTDVEGSTALLSRLGIRYAEALDAHREVLRRAWGAHSGTEMGTEGDSFFVVFATAPEAVSAAAQAQRELAGYAWPADEVVRVRMGVHTGSPILHGGDYVGLDVHRAARIAATAHGGQVVLSEATARLVERAGLDDVQLVDLGFHRLKDITQTERLFQLAGAGLAREFPPLKSLGTSTSLPRPTTPLVGRDSDVAELATLVESPGFRLLTLTGPGGSGKTRLGIAVAQASVQRFPDGVFFIPLAAVATLEVMWTTIGEAVDAPAQGPVPQDLFAYLGNRSALLVLDNLEQISGADAVVAELLNQAPEAVLIVTSRRPLNLAGEHQHTVSPLGLPAGTNMQQAQESGAVQLFTQHARAVDATFALTPDNVADVVAVCTGLDGLPLAIELAAARSKLLSPRALLNRLDHALDFPERGSQRPSRQKTLRNTIGWSYDLLMPTQQAGFRCLGVFSGGADLDAVNAVVVPDATGEEVLDLVWELVDASLVTITETADGEPRVRLLETIRAYALDELAASGERATTQRRHAQHYLSVAEGLTVGLEGDQYRSAADRFDAEHDNFRQALTWTLPSMATADSISAEDLQLGIRLCNALVLSWWHTTNVAEAQHWLTRAISRAGTSDSRDMARCLANLAWNAWAAADFEPASKFAVDAVEMFRRLDDADGVADALYTLGQVQSEQGSLDAARRTFQDAVTVVQQGDSEESEGVFRFLYSIAMNDKDYEGAKALLGEALSLARKDGAVLWTLRLESDWAQLLLRMDQPNEALTAMREFTPKALQANDRYLLVLLAEAYAAALAQLGDHIRAVRLLGTADALREQLKMPPSPSEAECNAPMLIKTRSVLPAEDWQHEYKAGRTITIENALITIEELPRLRPDS